MFISEKYKLVFLHIPKTGGCTIHYQLKELICDNTINPAPDIFHMTLRDIIGIFPECKKYFKFAVVRNPYDRLVSAYYDLVKIRKLNNTDFYCFCKNLSTYKNIILNKQASFINEKIDYIGKYESYSCVLNFLYDNTGIRLNSGIKLNQTSHNKYSEYYNEETKKIVYDFYKEDFEKFSYNKEIK